MCFCLPMSIIGAGYVEEIDRTNKVDYDDMTAFDAWEKKCKPTEEGWQKAFFDVLYAHLTIQKVSKRPFAYKALKAITIFLVILNIAVTMWSTYDWCEWSCAISMSNCDVGIAMRSLGTILDNICILVFLALLVMRVVATNGEYLIAPVGLCDSLSLAALMCTAFDE